MSSIHLLLLLLLFLHRVAERMALKVAAAVTAKKVVSSSLRTSVFKYHFLKEDVLVWHDPPASLQRTVVEDCEESIGLID